MAGQLTTHVLDTAQGKPAADVAIQLRRLGADGWLSLLRETVTNRDGRTDSPLLAGDELTAGVYEIIFAVGPYFAQQPVQTAEPPFLDQILIRFCVADPDSHYHVPLLVSPWAYTTYRGS